MNFDVGIIKKGLPLYFDIMAKVPTDDFCSPSFRTRFNSFYRVMKKTPEWYNAFYSVFKDCRTDPMSYEEVLTSVFLKTGEVDHSFCSKIVATLDPNKPILDKYVLQWMGISPNEPKDKMQRIEYYARIYDLVEREYNAHFSDENLIADFERFDRLIPEGKNLTLTKKLDFMLWSLRSDRIVSLLDYEKLLFDYEQLKNHK